MLDKNNEKTIERIVYNGKLKLVVEYGFSYIQGNKVPYFHIRASIYEKAKNGKWLLEAFGCNHKEITLHLPELKPLIKFHGWGQDGLPMYYLENGRYFFKEWKTSKLDKMDEKYSVFKSFVLFNESVDGFITDITDIVEWLENRKLMLQKLFNETMDEFGIERIKM